MTRNERWQRLLDLLVERGGLEVEPAAEVLGVSAATIRRDLDQLAEQQLLVRTRGGAVPHGVSYELPCATAPPAAPPRSSGSARRWRP